MKPFWWMLLIANLIVLLLYATAFVFGVVAPNGYARPLAVTCEYCLRSGE